MEGSVFLGKIYDISHPVIFNTAVPGIGFSYCCGTQKKCELNSIHTAQKPAWHPYLINLRYVHEKDHRGKKPDSICKLRTKDRMIKILRDRQRKIATVSDDYHNSKKYLVDTIPLSVGDHKQKYDDRYKKGYQVRDSDHNRSLSKTISAGG